MPAAARVGDPITHTNALRGLVAGVVIGAVVGAVVGAVIVGTVGAAAPLVLASAVAGGASLGGTIGEFLGSFSTSTVGQIVEGSPNVRVNSRKAAFCKSPATCSRDSGPQLVAQGSAKVFVNRFYAARTGDKGSCGFAIGPGSGNVNIGGGTAACGPVGSEVPAWAHTALLVLGLAGGGMGLAARGFRGVAIAARLGGAVVGGAGLSAGGHHIGGALFGEGSWQQTALTVGGAVIGGVLGDRGGGLAAAARDRVLIARYVAAGDIPAARGVLAPFVAAGNRPAIIQRLDVSSPRNGAGFWSGASAKTAAQQRASATGGVVLETTTGGRVIDNWSALNNRWQWDQGGRQFWGAVSTKYARGASGNISVVQSASKAARGGGDIWRDFELPELQRQVRRGRIPGIPRVDVVPDGP